MMVPFGFELVHSRQLKCLEEVLQWFSVIFSKSGPIQQPMWYLITQEIQAITENNALLFKTFFRILLKALMQTYNSDHQAMRSQIRATGPWGTTAWLAAVALHFS